MAPADIRARYALPGGIYLLSHSVGCLPVASREALQRHYLEPWATTGGDAWGPWLDAVTAFREELGLLLGASAAEFCPQGNVSAGLVKLLGALPATRRPRSVLMHASAFPSLGFAAQALGPLGIEARFIAAALPADDPDVWRQHLDDNVAAMLVTHVHSNTGIASPVAELCALARERGVISIVDIAQSVGVLPIDLANWQADVVLGSCVKWLCGGPGAGFLWIRDELGQTLQPIDVGWFSHEDPFEWDIRDFRYAPDALRFWGGTPSIAPFVCATAAIANAREIGIEAIRRHNQILLAELTANLADAAVRFPPLAQAGGTACLTFTTEAADRIGNALRETGCRFDRRGDTLRLSPHIYTDADDAARVADILAASAS